METEEKVLRLQELLGKMRKGHVGYDDAFVGHEGYEGAAYKIVAADESSEEDAQQFHEALKAGWESQLEDIKNGDFCLYDCALKVARTYPSEDISISKLEKALTKGKKAIWKRIKAERSPAPYLVLAINLVRKFGPAGLEELPGVAKQYNGGPEYRKALKQYAKTLPVKELSDSHWQWLMQEQSTGAT